MTDLALAALPPRREERDADVAKALREHSVAGDDDIVVHAGDVFHQRNE